MNRTVLIIDDERIIQRMLSVMLKRRGFTVFTAATAAEALNLLEHQAVDLITLDLMLPEVDGMEFLALLRADPRWAHIKVIMVSAAIFSRELQSARESGAQAVLNKPFTLRELDEVLEFLFGA